jgi:hypothetical protein
MADLDYKNMTYDEFMKPDRLGRTPFHKALWNQELDQVPQEILNAIPLNDKGWFSLCWNGTPALHIAALEGQIRFVPIKIMRALTMDENGWFRLDKDCYSIPRSAILGAHFDQILSPLIFLPHDLNNIHKLEALWNHAAPYITRNIDHEFYENYIRGMIKASLAITRNQGKKKFSL